MAQSADRTHLDGKSPAMESQLNSIAERMAWPRDADCLSGGGEAGALMRALDWSATPVGPVKEWPWSLRSAVGICLNSQVPSAIWWGREHLTMFYHDAYQTILGKAAAPHLLGRPTGEYWARNAEIFRPLIERVFTTGDGE